MSSLYKKSVLNIKKLLSNINHLQQFIHVQKRGKIIARRRKMNRYEKIQRGKGILNKYGKIAYHRHRRWWLIDQWWFCERVAMVAQGTVVATQESNVGGSTGGREGWLRKEEEEKGGRRRSQ